VAGLAQDRRQSDTTVATMRLITERIENHLSRQITLALEFRKIAGMKF
jgi:hypothetical protein